MTHEIRLQGSARRSLNQLPVKVRAAVLAFVYGPLADDPFRVGHPLRTPFDGQHTARRADYRIIYRILEAEVVVEVVRIAHRSDAYRG